MVSKISAFLAALFVVVVVTVTVPAHALIFDIDVASESLMSAIQGGGTARFNMKIINNEDKPFEYRIEIVNGPYPAWIQPIQPADNSGTLPANFTKIIPIKISPSLETAPGNYDFYAKSQVKINDKWVPLPSAYFTLNVLRSGEKAEGVATMGLYSDHNEYAPGSTARIVTHISKLTLAPEGLSVDLRLLDPKGSPVYEYLLPLSAQPEPIVLMHDIPISAIMPPGDYVVVADLKSSTGSISTNRKSISVSTVNKPEQRRTAEVSALGKRVTVKVENTGNVPVSGEIREPMRWYERFLLTANPTPALETGAVGYYWITWKYDNVMPGDLTRTYSYSISYVPVALAVLLIMLLGVAAWQTVRALSVTKEVIRQKISPTTLEASISVHVKNLSDHTIRDVVLVDALPGMARPVEFSTAKPANVKREENKTVMEWTLGDLNAREERVITYTVHTSFGVVGLITLPQATARFTGADGKRRHMSSGTVECGVVHQQQPQL